MRPRRLAMGIFLIASAGVLFQSMTLRSGPSLTTLPETIFLNLRWGDSPVQVARLRGKELIPISGEGHFYHTDQASGSNYRSLEEKDLKVLGREATATYTFENDQLISYHVFFIDSDGEAMDEDIRRYLKRLYGEEPSQLGEDSSLKLVWQFKDKIVNYWFYEDTLALRQRYKAGFGVVTKSNQY